ncbi:Small ubiquitin-related modifier [Thalictrum thalictroides]|uniref:Small ubiquitin-related modifier n=1 Tax=Thalictrum thalictroides TaxID=46969 RepID=A0A7J6VXD4_THATH|nr:Small ubiquitin-related modifier [Thalictrum thalictroides]
MSIVGKKRGRDEDTELQQDQPSFVNLKVKGQDGKEVFFRVKRNIHLGKLLSLYCEKQSLEFNAIAFLYDGRYIKKKNTPAQLGMEDGDEIDAMLHQMSG